MVKSFLYESDIETKSKCIYNKYFANRHKLFDQWNVHLTTALSYGRKVKNVLVRQSCSISLTEQIS